MIFTSKKTENCFADSETYEYRLPITGEQLLSRLAGWEIRKNCKLRRPVGIAQKDGVTVKTVLAGQLARVSFPQESWQQEKEKFESWLSHEQDPTGNLDL